MTPDTPRPGTPAPHAPQQGPHAPQQGKPVRPWPDPGTPSGAVLHAVIAGLIVWIIVSILSHVHIIISWHLVTRRAGCVWPCTVALYRRCVPSISGGAGGPRSGTGTGTMITGFARSVVMA